jgi:glycerophosphoryl diester phosphodiesterase
MLERQEYKDRVLRFSQRDKLLLKSGAGEPVTMGGLMRTPWIIAHRGASGHAPENTIAAFKRAVELGAHFIETDLHLTRDARFVAIHDPTLDRTTNGHGLVRDFTLAELKKLDAGLWFDRQFMGERVPTLEEVLAFAREHDVVFYLELKYEAAWGMHHALAAAIQSSGNAARTVVISFDPGTLKALRQLDTSSMMGLLVEGTSADAVKAVVGAGARQLCPRWDLVTRALVAEAHRADLQVVTWTVDEAGQMRTAIDAGVDGIMTDFPDRLRAVVEDMSSSLPIT